VETSRAQRSPNAEIAARAVITDRMRPSVAIAFVCSITSAHAEPGPPHPCAWRHYDEEPRCPGTVAVLDYNDEPNGTAPVEVQLPDREPALTPPPPPPPPRRPSIDYERDWRWQADVALGFGSAVVDGVGVANWPQLAVTAGSHFARLSVLGEYSLGAEHYSAPASGVIAMGSVPARDTDGVVHRFGAVARYAFVHGIVDTDGGSQLGGDIWLQGDFGEELTRWDEGGLLARPYLGVGLGIQGALRGSPHHRHALFMALRMQIARRSDLGGAGATCSAPCTEATPPEAWSDRSWQLRIGFLWGG